MEESDTHSGTISQEGHQKPSLKFLNRYVKGSVGAIWHDLGIELLDPDVDELDTIEAGSSDLNKCCTKMFQLWLKKQPTASWNQLIEALKQPGINLGALASKIEQMLLKPQLKEANHPIKAKRMEPQSTLISVTSLNADFASLLLSIVHILSNSPNQQDDLKTCKDFCLLLRVSEGSSESLFSAKNIAEIKECKSFKELLGIISQYISWDEHSILTHIVNECKSDEGKQEIEKFDKKMALYQGLQIISSTSNQTLSEDFVKFCIVIDKPYKNVTPEEYEKVKAYISANLNINAYATARFIRMFYHSLHIEWLVTIQAVPHMIKAANQSKNEFLKEKFVFMKIGSEIVIDDKDTLAQLLSNMQLFNLRTQPVKQKMILTGNDEELLMMEHDRSFRKLLGESSDAEICIMEYLKPFTIADEFSYVTDQITKLLHLDDPKILVDGCKTVMASDDVFGIKFFSDDQIEQLYCHHNTPLLLQELSYLWSWSNHSVLRVLVGGCDKAVKLLDVFDSHLDPFEPIAFYPVFETVPTDATVQTTLIVKFTRDVQEFTLQVVFDLCSFVVSNCGITHYCPQLIATQHIQGSFTIYWSIPKCVINLISSKVLQHKSKLYDMGMLEVTIYPDTKIITGNIANPNDVIRSTDHKVLQQSSKIWMLNAELKTLRKQHEQLIGIHTRYKSQEQSSTASQTVQVTSSMTTTLEEMTINNEQLRRENDAIKTDNTQLKINVDAMKYEITQQKDTTGVLTTLLDKMAVNNEDQIRQINSQSSEIIQPRTEVEQLKQTNNKSAGEQSDSESNTRMTRSVEMDSIGSDFISTNQEVDGLPELKEVTVLNSNEMGCGAYGKVYEVEYCKTICAAKEVHSFLIEGVNPAERQQIIKSFKKECKQCSTLCHPNITQFLGVWYPKCTAEGSNSKDTQLPVMVMEMMADSLTSYVNKHNKKEIHIHTHIKYSVIHDVSLGLNYLHSQNPSIVHCDLSPNNILLTTHQVAKISDLGIAKVMKTDREKTYIKAPDHTDFMPPETLANHPKYNASVDVFSFAGIILHAFTQLWPQPTTPIKFDENKTRVVLSEVKRRQKYLDSMEGEAKNLKPLVEQCLDDDPNNRPSAQVICKQIQEKRDAYIKNFPQDCHNTSRLDMAAPPMIPALTSGKYEVKWTRLADIPVPLYSVYAALRHSKVYVSGDSPNKEVLNIVYVYDIDSDQWSHLPPLDHYKGIPHIIGGKLAIIGGRLPAIKEITNMVSTYSEDDQAWVPYYPNLQSKRSRPGVVSHREYVIVAGGRLADQAQDSIEVLNWVENLQWTVISIKLPAKMCAFKPTVSDDNLLIVGYANIEMNSHSSAYKIPVATIIASINKPGSESTSAKWNELIAPNHWKTTIVPTSSPPVTVGGENSEDMSIADINIYDESAQAWKHIGSLSSPRSYTAVVPVHDNAIIIFGGHTEGGGVAKAKSSSLQITELGQCKSK